MLWGGLCEISLCMTDRYLFFFSLVFDRLMILLSYSTLCYLIKLCETLFCTLYAIMDKVNSVITFIDKMLAL